MTIKPSSAQNIYAPGTHILLDFFGAKYLNNVPFIEETLCAAAGASGATVLNVALHHFGEGQGVTGVALLAESHISIHTWPETGFAALDIFMCGTCDPHQAVEVLSLAFAPHKVKKRFFDRGCVS